MDAAEFHSSWQNEKKLMNQRHSWELENLDSRLHQRRDEIEQEVQNKASPVLRDRKTKSDSSTIFEDEMRKAHSKVDEAHKLERSSLQARHNQEKEAHSQAFVDRLTHRNGPSLPAQSTPSSKTSPDAEAPRKKKMAIRTGAPPAKGSRAERPENPEKRMPEKGLPKKKIKKAIRTQPVPTPVNKGKPKPSTVSTGIARSPTTAKPSNMAAVDSSKKRAASPSQRDKPSKKPRVEKSTRTKSFAEVSDQKIYHDTIIEFPKGSNKWYVVYCEEHDLHFRENAAQAAAKHLNSDQHGHLERNHELAINLLGYHIFDCSGELAKGHNDKIRGFYSQGYDPREEKRLQKRNPTTKSQTMDVNRHSQKHQDSPKSQGATSPSVDSDLQGITNPKEFHIYRANYNGRGFWPVLILGWGDITRAGLNPKWKTLSDSNLLNVQTKDDNDRPPPCYKVRNKGILGWETGYEDGGENVRDRVFPIRFFDENDCTGWMPAARLSELKLGDPCPPGIKKWSFEKARAFVAKDQGFKNWAALKGRRRGETGNQTTQPRGSGLQHAKPSATWAKGCASTLKNFVVASSDSELSSLDLQSSDDESVNSELERIAEEGGDESDDLDYSADIKTKKTKTGYALADADSDDKEEEDGPEIMDSAFRQADYSLRSSHLPRTKKQVIESETASGTLPPLQTNKAQTSPGVSLPTPVSRAASQDTIARDAGNSSLQKAEAMPPPATGSEKPVCQDPSLTKVPKFCLSRYNDGTKTWDQAIEGRCLWLYEVSEGKVVQSNDDEVDIKIDPNQFPRFETKSLATETTRLITLFRKDGTDKVELVFGQDDSSDLLEKPNGKHQSYEFVDWLYDTNPDARSIFHLL